MLTGVKYPSAGLQNLKFKYQKAFACIRGPPTWSQRPYLFRVFGTAQGDLSTARSALLVLWVMWVMSGIVSFTASLS